MPSPETITINQLIRLIGTPDAPMLIDVRIDEDFALDPRHLPGSFRHDHTDILALSPELAGRKAVIICQKGLKLSQGAAAILRCHGIACQHLEGGHLAWADAGESLIPSNKIPNENTQVSSLWVTRHRPKIDRLACPWLIRRFVDPRAQFLFVAPSEVLGVAERFDATPFDIEDVYWSHRGEFCTFDTMLEEFQLQTPALARLATIVRGADTNRHDLAPQSAGLLAASLGLSRMYKDDLRQLEAGMILYDSFYRWARDAVSETHDWPATSAQRRTDGN